MTLTFKPGSLYRFYGQIYYVRQAQEPRNQNEYIRLNEAGKIFEILMFITSEKNLVSVLPALYLFIHNGKLVYFPNLHLAQVAHFQAQFKEIQEDDSSL
jgi:hypothetical protein